MTFLFDKLVNREFTFKSQWGLSVLNTNNKPSTPRTMLNFSTSRPTIAPADASTSISTKIDVPSYSLMLPVTVLSPNKILQCSTNCIHNTDSMDLKLSLFPATNLNNPRTKTIPTSTKLLDKNMMLSFRFSSRYTLMELTPTLFISIYEANPFWSINKQENLR